MPTAEEIEITKRLMVLLKEPNLVSDYIRRFGLVINAQNIKEVKERKKGTKSIQAVNPVLAARAARLDAINANNAAAAAAAASSVAEATKAGATGGAGGTEQDPIFESTVNCPICGCNGITSYELRAKSQQVVQTPFLVPVYTGAKGFRTADYTHLAVAVCPECFFASPDRKNFNYPSITGKGEERSTLPAVVLSALKDKTDERKGILPMALNNKEYFKRERSPQVAIESYRLAMARAGVEAELSQPYGYFKIGSYMLKIAYIMKTSGMDDTEALKEALGYFEKSFSKSECTTDELEMQVVYLVVTLNIRLGDFTKANSYLGVFGKLMIERQEQMKRNPNPSLNTQWIEKWQDRARYIWEERENPEVFSMIFDYLYLLKIVIDNVELALAHPVVIKTEWIGQSEPMRQILACWMVLDKADFPLTPRVIGYPGIGKTTLAIAAARVRGQDVYIMQCTSDTRPEDLLVTPVLSDQGKISYHASPLLTAAIKGGIAILDEGNRMSEKSWASLAGLFDNRRMVESIAAGISVTAHDEFRAAVTMNEDSSTFEIPDYIMSRLQPGIRIPFPDRDDEMKILTYSLPFSGEEILVMCVNYLQKAHKLDLPYSVRDGINIVRYALKLKESGDNASVDELFKKAIGQILGEDSLDLDKAAQIRKNSGGADIPSMNLGDFFFSDDAALNPDFDED